MNEAPIFKDCGKSFIPLVEKVLDRLSEEESEWILANVRFSQRLPWQRTVDRLCEVTEDEEVGDEVFNEASLAYRGLMAYANSCYGNMWKHARYYYIRLSPAILRFENQEDALFTIAHELGHCFHWLPAKQRKDEKTD